MQSKQPKFRRPTSLTLLSGVVVALASIPVALAQPAPGRPPDNNPVATFYLNSGASLHQSNEVLTAVRIMIDPSTKVFLNPAENSILVHGTQAQIDLAQKVISDMNHPQKDLKLTFTMTEMDGSKRVGVQHYTLTMSVGAHTTLKQGSKIPIATGSGPSSGMATQFTFIDVGINLDATLDPAADGVRLSSKVEDSGLIEDKMIAGVSEPIIRQTVLEGTSLLQPGKPLALGSLDVPGSTRHLDVEVLLTPLP